MTVPGPRILTSRADGRRILPPGLAGERGLERKVEGARSTRSMGRGGGPKARRNGHGPIVLLWKRRCKSPAPGRGRREEEKRGRRGRQRSQRISRRPPG